MGAGETGEGEGETFGGRGFDNTTGGVVFRWCKGISICSYHVNDKNLSSSVRARQMFF